MLRGSFWNRGTTAVGWKPAEPLGQAEAPAEDSRCFPEDADCRAAAHCQEHFLEERFLEERLVERYPGEPLAAQRCCPAESVCPEGQLCYPAAPRYCQG